MHEPEFDDSFRETLKRLFAWRRDVRHFRSTPVRDELVEELVELACLAPSVGYSQPWRFMRVDDPGRRAGVKRSFEQCNREAMADYEGDEARLYAQLKLAGLDDAPVHLAIFVDRDAPTGKGLGRKSMPATLDYSVVMAIHTFWLAARAVGVGVGWVSILNPVEVERILEAEPGWSLIAYLCVGYPVEAQPAPELERRGWERRLDAATLLVKR